MVSIAQVVNQPKRDAVSYRNYYSQTFERDLELFFDSYLDYYAKFERIPRVELTLEKISYRPGYWSNSDQIHECVPAFTNYFLIDALNPFSAVSRCNRAYFVIALFFTVLIDQVAHHHYPIRTYLEFQKLTRYPKYLDNPCSQRMMDPCGILRGLSKFTNLQSTMLEANPVMHSEVCDFFKRFDYFKVDSEEFWNRCINHVPDLSKQF